MVLSCCALGCTERATEEAKGNDLSFHSIPGDPLRREAWLEKINRMDPKTKKPWIPKCSAKVCSKHFTPEDFITNRGYILLKKMAVPTIFKFDGKPSKKKVMYNPQSDSESDEAPGTVETESYITPVITETDCEHAPATVQTEKDETLKTFNIVSNNMIKNMQTELDETYTCTSVESESEATSVIVDTNDLSRTGKTVNLEPEVKSYFTSKIFTAELNETFIPVESASEDVSATIQQKTIEESDFWLSTRQRVFTVLWYHESRIVNTVISQFSQWWPGSIPPNAENVVDLYFHFCNTGTVLDFKQNNKSMHNEENLCKETATTDDYSERSNPRSEVTGAEETEYEEIQCENINEEGVLVEELPETKESHLLDHQDYTAAVIAVTLSDTDSQAETSLQNWDLEDDSEVMSFSVQEAKHLTKWQNRLPQEFKHSGRDVQTNEDMQQEDQQCSECGIICSGNLALQKHTLSTHSKPVYKCGVQTCGQLFLKCSQLTKHLNSFHADVSGSLYQCAVCDSCYAVRSSCVRHVLRHGKDLYRCSMCSKSFRSKQSMEDHMLSHKLQSDRPFVCEHCGKSFKLRSSLKVHIRDHSDKQNCSKDELTCQVCSKIFMTRRSLWTHQEIHKSDEKIICDKCGKAFKQKSNLAAHIKTVHCSGEGHYQCSDCGKYFKNYRPYKDHLNQHLGLNPYSCTVCTKTFRRRRHFVEHMYMHNGSKPFKCRHCGKGFASSSNTRTHEKVHEKKRKVSLNVPFDGEAICVDLSEVGNVNIISAEIS